MPCGGAGSGCSQVGRSQGSAGQSARSAPRGDGTPLAKRGVEETLDFPAVACRVRHGYDLGEPFDLLTSLKCAPANAAAFEELVALLRTTEKWRYVVRKIDVQLIRPAE
jgi:hypothetical protein